MRNQPIENLSRRAFVKAGLAAGAGLTLGLYLPDALAEGEQGAPKATAPFAPNAFVRIGTDDRVTVVCKHLEMGQGTYTGLATLVAEELDARWDQVVPVSAPADASRYANLFWGKAQGTGGSTAIANSYEQMRKAGAAARAMLVAAAAKRWQVPEDEVSVADGVLSAPDGRRAAFGELAQAASALPVPEEVELKDPSRFKLIGNPALRRKDSAAKIDGSAQFTQDIRLPGMLTAVVARAPRFGARLKTFDPARARSVPGVVQVVAVPTGVAVLADGFWAAKQGRDALAGAIDWDESDAFRLGSTEILAQYRDLAGTPGAIARNDGAAEQALAGAGRVLEADYTVPYLPHASMEPLDCAIAPEGDGVRIYNGDQSQTADQAAVAKVLGLQPVQVRIDTLFSGGSFGRRANPHSDYVVEAAEVFKAAGGRTPIKVVWTREDDTRGGQYRPLYLHRIHAAIGADGMPLAWHHRIVGQSILAGTFFEKAMVKDGIDRTSVEGAANLPYRIPNLRVELHSPKLGVPVQWWRSVGSSHTAFAVESMLDELAALAGKDPVEYRMGLLEGHPRHQGVLRLAADKAGWGAPLPTGHGRGVAVHESFNSYVAEIAEVSVTGGAIRVERVVVAVDCGVPVNPNVIAAQMEGGMGFGLSAALLSELTLDAGHVRQSNFHDFRILPIGRMPRVEVHIVPSTQPPTGVGEPGVPPIAPAVANAVFAATGKRLRALPLRLA